MKTRSLSRVEIDALRTEAGAILHHADHMGAQLRIKLHSDPVLRALIARSGARSFVGAVRDLRGPGDEDELALLLREADRYTAIWLARMVAGFAEVD